MTWKQRAEFISACNDGKMDIIDSMLDQGFNPNYIYNGVTPLQVASTKINPWGIDVVTKLITHGAIVDMKNIYDWNALCCSLATRSFQRHVAQLLLDCSKLGVNYVNSKGRNYLSYSVTPQACMFLIDNGINVNNINFDGDTVLDITLNSDIRTYLISAGAKRASEL